MSRKEGLMEKRVIVMSKGQEMMMRKMALRVSADMSSAGGVIELILDSTTGPKCLIPKKLLRFRRLRLKG